MTIFTGAGTALMTPFKDNGAVDYDAFDRLIEFQIDNAIDALIICGTTGESSTLSEEEHSEVIRHAIRRINGRVPVIAGTGSNSTATAVELSKHAEADGADGVLAVTPYYNKATQKGLKDYYTQIAEGIKIPVIIYNVPGRTACNVQPETAVDLARNVENIVAIKEASGDINQIGRLAALANGCIDMYSGNDDHVVPLLSLGGKGVISVLSNIAPRQMHDMVAKWMAGDVEGARQMQLEAMSLIGTLFCEINPIPVKKAAELMGLCGGTLRSPMTELEAKNLDRLKNDLTQYGLL